MRSNARPTKPEAATRSALHRHGFRFRKSYRIRIGDRWTQPDLVFTRARVAVFVDGCFWHRCPEHGNTPRSNPGYWGPKLDRNVERDRETDRRLRQLGWTVIRAWEHDAPERTADRVACALKAQAVPSV
jgi:DNA mismatch endonuclease, patch repair protein